MVALGPHIISILQRSSVEKRATNSMTKIDLDIQGSRPSVEKIVCPMQWGDTGPGHVNLKGLKLPHYRNTDLKLHAPGHAPVIPANNT